PLSLHDALPISRLRMTTISGLDYSDGAPVICNGRSPSISIFSPSWAIAAPGYVYLALCRSRPSALPQQRLLPLALPYALQASWPWRVLRAWASPALHPEWTQASGSCHLRPALRR